MRAGECYAQWDKCGISHVTCAVTLRGVLCLRLTNYRRENLVTQAIHDQDLDTEFRNVAIVAHVDHGKTTLVDGMLWES